MSRTTSNAEYIVASKLVSDVLEFNASERGSVVIAKSLSFRSAGACLQRFSSFGGIS